MFIINFLMSISDFLWGYPILFMTFGLALYFTLRLKGFQFVNFGHILKNTLGKILEKSTEEGGISPFQACCTALASTLGVGNIAGVSVAIAMGGPGAVFWMWLVALMGLIVKYSEIVLAVKYREKNPETGIWQGGFMWYVKNGLGSNWKFMSVIWAAILACGMVFAPAVQINSVATALTTYFPIPSVYVGIFSAILLALVLFGGIKWISKFAEAVVPFMALAYTVVSIFVIGRYFTGIPAAFALIFKSAFTGTAATGGFVGSTIALAIRWGLARGVYSNEAGTGVAALAHSSATVDHPAKQGLWGVMEVFIDTIIVCSMTALVVILTGVWDNGLSGAALTTSAFAAGFGNETAAGIFVSIIILFFAFTTALVNIYYGEICINYLFGKILIFPYRVLGCAFAIIGSLGAMTFLWGLFDFFYGVCVVLNLIILFALRKEIFAITKDYVENYIKVKAD